MNAPSCVADIELRNLKLICEQRKDLEKVDEYGNTALLKSCYLGQTRSVKMLLKAGANFKAINNLGNYRDPKAYLSVFFAILILILLNICFSFSFL